ncbi:MAG: Asp-tRNA(Asn)/Glu-tRNA(Gln) amidotransferase GatCAB subunit B, partial [Campylobacterales bacterium]
ANVSIRPKGDPKLYTRVEIKNLNSFKFIQKAIEYEVNRQIEAWEDGVYDKEVVQETRLFDTIKGETRSMRGKEESADYRYFPDPDLPPLIITQELLDATRELPELPDEKKERLIRDYGLKPYDASVITSDLDMVRYFEDLIALGSSAKAAVTWLTVELQGRLTHGQTIATSPVGSAKLAHLIRRIEDGTISARAGKEVLDYLMEHDEPVDNVIEKLGLKQVSDDGALIALIEGVVAAHPKQLEEYRGGKEALFGFFVGQVMKASKGSANPQRVNELLKEILRR